MHMPEMWGEMQFSGLVAGSGEEKFIPDPDRDRKWALMMVYYAESAYFSKNGKYSANPDELGLKPGDFPANQPLPVIQITSTAFECSIPGVIEGRTWTIFQDSRLVGNAASRPAQ